MRVHMIIILVGAVGIADTFWWPMMATEIPVSTPSPAELSDNKIIEIVEKMWKNDANRFPTDDYECSTGGPKYFVKFNRAILNSGAWPQFMALLDNYQLYVGTAEPNNPSHVAEETAFINKIISTSVMTSVREGLDEAGLAKNDDTTWRNMLEKMWFRNYPRSTSSNVKDTSGFEHVFVGEIKVNPGNRKNDVKGFHNWVQFFEQEDAGNVIYRKQLKSCEPNITSLRFTWHQAHKPRTTMMLGASPEFEIGVYTLCTLARPNDICTVSFGGHQRNITTKQRNYPPEQIPVVDTIYPTCT